ncbi:hypothetical protein [Paenibacillus glufosinatiresistens]|uniref:hypothetical protein n=1 Tax=Paenibacillus glufosinatiresistens TaxID=3070657 RepID=UPI00286E9139|nr:hypothetical protein [Paenibacillus sp. YX.27]
MRSNEENETPLISDQGGIIAHFNGQRLAEEQFLSRLAAIVVNKQLIGQKPSGSTDSGGREP